ncbi:MAG: FKBP-type peptidyl-prolyl cis-trans isomerase [Sedimentisphaerales bacterium]|nr:FKBP-type peptidyl-prolyl cis-trans isomerase [Sedimentisphaerales bacterium]
MLIRKGVKLLEEREGDGDAVERQREYVLSMRFTLSRGEVVDMSSVSSRPGDDETPDAPGFYEFSRRIDREQLIPGVFYAVQGMRIGGYRKVGISPHLAYGEKGYLDMIPPNAKLTVEIKVLRKTGKPRKQQAELPEAEALTQDQLCQRYQIDPQTLWRQRKAGLLPAPVVAGGKVRWLRTAIEQWEAKGQPPVSLYPDEVESQRRQTFDRMDRLLFGEPGGPTRRPSELSPAEQEECRRLWKQIEHYDEQRHDLMLELALLIDEAGQWTGPPLEPFVKGDNVSYRRTGHVWHTVETILGE